MNPRNMAIGLEHENEEPDNIKTCPSFESSFPPEIIVEVFLRLRVESLLRCKCVCKLWRSLISDPHFVNSHLILSTRNNDYVCGRLIFLNTMPNYNLVSCSLYDVMHDNFVKALEVDYPLKNTSNFPLIVGSCNGLLCLVIGNRNLYILNPSTRRSKMLPYYNLEAWHDCYGFGYDESSHDYKVVAIYSDRYRGKDGTKARIYSLKTGKWKDIGHSPHGLSSVCSCMFSNGAFHWLANCIDSYSSVRIVSLDLENETYGEVLQPVYDDQGSMGLTLGSVGKWLCLVCNYVGIRYDVWVMKVYGVKESWTKLVSIPYLINDWRYSISVPLCISNDGKVLLKLREKLVLYNSKNASFSEIKNFDECHRSYTFVESLVSPDALTLQ